MFRRRCSGREERHFAAARGRFCDQGFQDVFGHVWLRSDAPGGDVIVTRPVTSWPSRRTCGEALRARRSYSPAICVQSRMRTASLFFRKYVWGEATVLWNPRPVLTVVSGPVGLTR